MPTLVFFHLLPKLFICPLHDLLCAYFTVIFSTRKARVTTATCLRRSISGPSTDDKILKGSVCGYHQPNGILFPHNLTSLTFFGCMLNLQLLDRRYILYSDSSSLIFLTSFKRGLVSAAITMSFTLDFSVIHWNSLKPIVELRTHVSL